MQARAFADVDSLELSLATVDADHVAVTLRNNADTPVTFLRWGSPFDAALTRDLFNISVVGDTDRAGFSGRLIKRIAPVAEDFITLAAGDFVEAIVPVVRYYHLPTFGEYTVGLNWPLQYLDDNGALSTKNIAAPAIVATLLPQPDVSAAVAAGFSSCAADQQVTIQQAVEAAEQMAVEARDGLASLSDDGRLNSPRYQQWFGSYDETRFDLVLDTFDRLAGVVETESIQFDCSCDENGYFAFVFPSQPYDIYLCPAFWRASLVGRDSKAGTILHELTHFPQIQGTSDFAYSTAAIALAEDNPEQAVRNADSYEYFAENVPQLDIFNGVVFSVIELGVEVSNVIASGQSSFYKVTGAEYVELFSDTGNANLEIYATAANEEVICSAASTAASDLCEVNSGETVYIGVTALEDSNYRLLANNEPVVTVQTGDSTDSEDTVEPELSEDPTSEELASLDNLTDTDATGSTDGGGGAFSLWVMLLLAARLSSLTRSRKVQQ